MAFKVEHTIACDHSDCPSEITVLATDQHEAAYEIRRHGWTVFMCDLFDVPLQAGEWRMFCSKHTPVKTS